MIKILFVLIIAIVIIGIFKLIEFFFANDDKDISDKLIEGGIALVVATIPSFSDKLIQFLYDFLNVEKSVVIDELSPWWLVGLGLLLLSVGIILKIIDASAKCVILNMPGTIHHTKDDGMLKALNTNNCDEIEISTTNCQAEMQKISQTKVKAVLGDMQLQMDRFNRMSNYKRCFTGMAPIPFVILAGTKHKGSDITYYLEFNKAIQQYVKLNKEKKYPKLIKPEIVSVNAKEIVVSVSTTAVINDTNTNQFKMPVFNLSLKETKDNAIHSKKQLNEYVNDTVTFISEICKKNSGITKVNLLLATQACFAYALGKAFVLMQNRVPQIVSYHYVAPSYTTGIVINGRESGQVVKV